MLAHKLIQTGRTIPTGGGVSVPSVPVYRAIIHPAEDVGGYWASCDMENGGCTVQGDTIQETQRMMLEAVAIYLEDDPDIKNYHLAFEYGDA